MSFAQFQVVLAAVMIVPIAAGLIGCSRLCRRIGLPGWSSLIVLLPVVNIAAVYWLAFARRVQGAASSET
jgi:hypothetical protein